jgi:hypothetical protein
MYRLMFLPTIWLTQGATNLMSILAPLVFLMTGLAPLTNASVEAVVNYIVPMVFALLGGLCVFAPGKYFPLAGQVLSTFQSFKNPSDGVDDADQAVRSCVQGDSQRKGCRTCGLRAEGFLAICFIDHPDDGRIGGQH